MSLECNSDYLQWRTEGQCVERNSCTIQAFDGRSQKNHSQLANIDQAKWTLDNEHYMSKWEFLKEEFMKTLNLKVDGPMIKFYKENKFLWNHFLSYYNDRDNCSTEKPFSTRNQTSIALPENNFLTENMRELKGPRGLELVQTTCMFHYGSILSLLFIKQCKD